MADSQITWVLEGDVFAQGDCLREAALQAGQRVVDWSDNWWEDSAWPKIAGPVIFHGSLGNADRIARELPWKPGAYCDTENFRCSAWYHGAAEWILHEQWAIVAASQFVRDADAIVGKLGPDQVFVRPDSPLKPFAGRVLPREKISLAALDHGFYYDDPDLLVVVAPVREVSKEWRFVIVNNQVVAGSGYAAEGRKHKPDDSRGTPWRFAAEVAASTRAPEAVYVLDVCESDRGLRLLELNPFSGADLYACDGDAIVQAVARAVRGAL